MTKIKTTEMSLFRNEVSNRLWNDNLSLRQAAGLTGVSFSTLSRLLRGRGEPSNQTFRALAAWLDGKDIKVRRQICSRIVKIQGTNFRLTLEEI